MADCSVKCGGLKLMWVWGTGESMRRWINLGVICALCAALLPLAASVSASPAPAAAGNAPITAADAVPRFEGAKCPFPLRNGEIEGQTVECGFVVVREQHSNPDSPTIRLAVARWKSKTATPDPAPVIFLQGGPGGGSLTSAFVRSVAGLFTDSRDYIAFDQRGTGRSEPSLDCPEARDQGYRDDSQPISVADELQHEIDAELACRDRLVGQGINLAAYDSTQSAADVNDIRAVFGYAQMNLLGISYGTRLGLTVLRDYSSVVRSAVLDSVSPLSASNYEDYATHLDQAINALFADCTAAANCNTAFPTLKDDFSRAYARLNAQPMTVTVKDSDTNQQYNLVMDGPRFMAIFHAALYSASAIAILPRLIAEINAGRSDLLRRVVEVFYFSPTSIGMAISVRCNEYIPFNDRARAVAALQNLMPEVRDTEGVALLKNFDLCPQWPTHAPNPVDHQPVVSDVPALVLESADDPQTPPAYGKRAAETLSHSFYVETPGIGHSVIGNGGTCAVDMVRAFVADPTTKPQTTCVSGLGVSFITS
jgi:pimeloyl-ACP methyl ester carboxylesterase